MSIPLIKRMRLVAQITRGLFLTDAKHSLFGRLWQLFLRFTWELPQTLIGWIYSVTRALVGQVDRVDAFGGITFVTKKVFKYSMGVSLGTFVDLWAAPWMLGEGSRYVLGNQICMHEFVMTLENEHKQHGFSALDIAKGHLDRGIHPPTMYFPLIVHEALMAEPTETESKETLEAAAKIFLVVYDEAMANPAGMHNKPEKTVIGRPDEVTAARKPVLKYGD